MPGLAADAPLVPLGVPLGHRPEGNFIVRLGSGFHQLDAPAYTTWLRLRTPTVHGPEDTDAPDADGADGAHRGELLDAGLAMSARPEALRSAADTLKLIPVAILAGATHPADDDYRLVTHPSDSRLDPQLRVLAHIDHPMARVWYQLDGARSLGEVCTAATRRDPEATRLLLDHVLQCIPGLLACLAVHLDRMPA